MSFITLFTSLSYALCLYYEHNGLSAGVPSSIYNGLHRKSYIVTQISDIDLNNAKQNKNCKVPKYIIRSAFYVGYALKMAFYVRVWR